MTPHPVWRQTSLAFLFLAVGLLIIGLAIAPAVLGLLAHPPVRGDVSLVLLVVGLIVALLGAWMLPFGGAPAAVTGFVAVVGPWVPRLPGQSRVGDPKPDVSPVTPPSDKLADP